MVRSKTTDIQHKTNNYIQATCVKTLDVYTITTDQF